MSEFDAIAHYYDAQHADLTDDLPFYQSHALHTGGPLLELGCGTGRLTVPLAQAGHTLTGVDASAPMLDIARQKVAQARLENRITLLEGDMRRLQLAGRFRLAFAPLNTFMHLPTLPDQLAALRCWRRHLVPAGWLILDLFHPGADGMLASDNHPTEDRRWHDTATGATVQLFATRTVDTAAQTVQEHLQFDETMPGGQVRRTLATVHLRFLWRYEAELLLDKAGFALDTVYGSWQMEPFAADSPRLILVARSREGETDV